MKPTAKQLREEAALLAKLEDARQEGRGWFENHTDDLLAEVHRQGSRMYDGDGLGKHYALAFAEGFHASAPSPRGMVARTCTLAIEDNGSF